MDTGFVHIYTGEGKGKTTAAVGLAVRARSRDLRVLFVQFFKQGAAEGELRILQEIGVETLSFDRIKSPLFHPGVDRHSQRHEVREALSFLDRIFTEDRFDVIIIDEFLCLIAESLVSEDEAVAFVREKPPRAELVLTGRGATGRIMETADYVTYMENRKHPFDGGLPARKGIEA